MFGSGDDWAIVFVILAVIFGIVGWAVIESLIWLFSHIHWVWG